MSGSHDIFEIGNNGAALDKASEYAGEYLASINKADLRELTPEEWRSFLKVIIAAWDANVVPF